MKIGICCSVVCLLLSSVSLAWSAGSEMTAAPMPLTPEDGSGAVALSTSDYILGPSDLLQIDVFQVDELSGTERINAAGYIKMPLIGSVKVAGLTQPSDYCAGPRDESRGLPAEGQNHLAAGPRHGR